MEPHFERTKELITLLEKLILQELESVQTNIKLIQANQKGHFTLNKIICHESRLAIEQSREAIKTFSELKRVHETKLISLEEVNKN